MNDTTSPQGLSVEGLTIARRADGQVIVDGIDFHVGPGETLGIVGESGSGKSLTLRAIAGCLSPALEIRGEIRAHDLRTAMIFQEPATALNPTMRVGDLVAGTWRIHHPGAGRREATAKAVALLERVGIPRAAARMRAWPHELSGGMRQRVMIAAALATDADLLLCDEPTTALDVRVQRQILDLLGELVGTRGMAMIFVSHDLAVVSSVCRHTLVMRAGGVVEEGPVRQVLSVPRHEYTRQLLDANLARRIEDTAGGTR